MRELRTPTLPTELGETLDRAVYNQDFRERKAEIRNRSSWKFERRQHFEETGNASRDALLRGDWRESIRLISERREGLLEASELDRRRGAFLHRVRVVETPLTPYMQWQLHSLRLRAECGHHIRVIGLGALPVSDRGASLPEVVILGGRNLYNVLYTKAGVPNGAVRFTDPEIITNWEGYIGALYKVGEDVRTFFDREVAHLPPPTVAAE
ncbi:hypothetical protein CLV63_1531 [Murinocardiopsis flavida]|uniref:DUF6879 domain-containing protein n=1 Tax=Murinocardiopsis flavida TaxID=645275 RepID=A0A2P8C6G1_9ACTN|nr:DUF6879 family protein [Murinocardiopsis flavida]PSK80559.1 hypothetical protein CLV63_1531 [Murinocardiopsis flavida]